MKRKEIPKLLWDTFLILTNYFFFFLMIMFDVILLTKIYKGEASLLETGITFLMLIETRRQYNRKIPGSLRV